MPQDDKKPDTTKPPVDKPADGPKRIHPSQRPIEK